MAEFTNAANAHAADALGYVNHALAIPMIDPSHSHVAIAQVCATLALAAETRLLSLVTIMAEHEAAAWLTQSNDEELETIRIQIRERLGLQ